MANHKKEQERDELHRAIWGIADDLRGSVDGWDFKSYVIGIMFYRYISENLTSYVNKGEIESGKTDFNYADMSDDDGEPFEEKMARLTSELSEMFTKSHELEEEIRRKLGAIGYEI